ncbi:MAG: helix-hairpin-helix domain-containing protein [Planctomycetes bacterium]|nr:helix-hairpin-helix domain-containing protein [Planctomycetota bacterium]
MKTSASDGVVLGLVGWLAVILAQAVRARAPSAATAPASPWQMAESTLEAPRDASSGAAAPRGFDLETASARDLRRLPGIGEVRALEIVRERHRLRGSGVPLDLASLPGIGAKTAERVAAALASARASPPPREVSRERVPARESR